MELESLVKQFSDVLLRVTLSATLAFMPAYSGCKDKDDDDDKPVATTSYFSLDGIVRSSWDNQPMYGVKVTVLNAGGSAGLVDTTDANGHYQLSSVPDGTRTVRFEFDNYIIKEEVINVANTNKTFDVIITPQTHVIIPYIIGNNLKLLRKHSPYIVVDDVKINPGAKLSIEEGVEVRIDSSKKIEVNGSLEVLGTPTKPVRFTVDKNGKLYNGLSLVWHGIHLLGSNLQAIVLNNVIIDDAHDGISIEHVDPSAFQSQNLVIKDNPYKSGSGIVFKDGGGVFNLQNTTIDGFDIGIEIQNEGFDHNFANITILNCNKFGIYALNPYGGSHQRNITLNNSRIQNCSEGVYLEGRYNTTLNLSNTLIERCSGTGVKTSGGLIINSRIKKCKIGISQEKGQYSNTNGLENSIIEKCNTGIIVKATGRRYSVNYSTFTGNTLGVDNRDTTNISNSIFWDNQTDLIPNVINPVGLLNVLFIDPLFIDPVNGDYRLQQNSPVKIAGPGGTEIGAYGNNGSPP